MGHLATLSLYTQSEFLKIAQKERTTRDKHQEMVDRMVITQNKTLSYVLRVNLDA
jgi:hypothetical protein